MKPFRMRYRSFVAFGMAMFFLFGAKPKMFAQDYTHPRKMHLPPSEFQRPDPEQFRVTLKNGLVAYIAEEHRMPLATIVAFVRAGWADAKKPGAAHVLKQVLLQGGSNELSNEAFKKKLQELAADFHVKMGPEITEVSFNVPAEDARQGLEMLFNLLTQPDLSDETIQAQISKIEEKLTPSKAEDGESGPVLHEGSLNSAVERFNDLLFSDHSYAKELGHADYERLTAADIRRFRQSYFVPGNVVLAFSGDFDANQAEAKLQANFETWQATKVPKARKPAKLNSLQTRRIHTYPVDKLQAWVVLGHELPVVPTKNQAALEVMNYILGGGHFDTRLFRETRDKRGLTNDASGFLEPNWFGAGTYTFRTYGRPEVVNLLVELMLHEIERIRSEPVTEQELFVAKNALAEGVFQMQFENGHATARTFAKEWLRYRNHQATGSYVERIRRVVAKDILNAAKKYLHPERMQMVLVGPIEKVRSASFPEGDMRLEDFGEIIAGK